ncbi:hypothetical protein BRC82_01195 [Halobacteriales archaeon QS_1_67_19]|nr:MAG: hypothetical protein BRC82_01195 [Halobacteriales archaeon QS_1_67_19]
MHRSAVFAVALAVVLAGCGGFSGGTGSEADATTTDGETTAVVGTIGEQTDADPPPGLSTAGVTDPDALAAAHEAALADRSFSYDREARIVAANGTELGRWHQRAQVGPDRRAVNYSQTGAGVSVSGLPVETARIYTNGSITFRYGGEEYHRESGPGFAPNTFSNDQLLAAVFSASETTVTEVRRDDRTWYRVRATGDDDTLTYRGPNGTVEVRATSVTATALVAPSGLVRNVTYEFDFVRGDASGHRTITIRYAALGETTVEVPDWVADAKAATNATEAE